MAKIYLQEIAKKKGVHLFDVATEAGLSPAFVYKIGKTANNLRLSTIESLCRVLDCDLSDLIVLDKDKN